MDDQTAIPQILSPEQERYLHGYSLGSLTYNFIYFRAMADRPLAWISFVFALVPFLIPGLFILPFFARRRAWELRTWSSFEQFRGSQRGWDRAGLVGLAVAAVALALFWNVLTGLLGTLAPGGGSTTDQLKQVQQNLQDLTAP